MPKMNSHRIARPSVTAHKRNLQDGDVIKKEEEKEEAGKGED